MGVKSYTVTVYAVKSKRSNAQCNYKSWSTYSGYPNLKHTFTNDMDYADIKDWMKRQPNHLYRMVVYDGTICLHTCSTTLYRSQESLFQVAHTFMELFNARNKDVI